MRVPFLIAAILLGLTAGEARADLVGYLGPHPVDPGLTKGMCQIDGPHLHAYAPHKPVLYVEAGGQWAFIGDPVEFEAAAPKHAYYGHHPTFWVETPDGLEPAARGRHYCYISGPHHHWYPPPATLSFKLKGGAYWYVGPVPAWYQRKWRRRSPLDDHYHAVVLVRPQVVVDVPPPGYVGIYFGGGGGAVVGGGAVHVGGPRVEVRVPVPGIGISIGGGGYGGGGYGGGYVVAPGHRRGYGPPGHAKAHGHKGHGKGHGKGKRR
ncbi:MAG: hypothetical protein ACOY3Y_06620 [Acidobacteriota bacterium]